MKTRTPKIGDEISVPTQMYIDHGEDDILGGRATIIGFNKYLGIVLVIVKEVSHQFNLAFLMAGNNQEEWKKEYGNRYARPDPDIG